MKVENFEGKKNQFVILGDEGEAIFQSYDSIIAKIEGGEVDFGKNWDYSTTTSKYLYKFLNQYIKLINTLYHEDIKNALGKGNKKANFQKLIDKGIIFIDSNL